TGGATSGDGETDGGPKVSSDDESEE
ncbi:MAG: hypothetical protein QOJ26_1229, partial [Thermoplasmata archaeon]|nr:hypothetical protein [Thermoplasmata archaeon]